MNKTLVQNSEDDVDHQNGAQQKQPHAGKRVLKSLCSSLKSALNITRENSIGLLFDKLRGISQCGSRFQVKTESDCRQLTEVVHREGPHRRHEPGNSIERNEL